MKAILNKDERTPTYKGYVHGRTKMIPYKWSGKQKGVVTIEKVLTHKFISNL
jgi:hypothetical protein